MDKNVLVKRRSLNWASIALALIVLSCATICPYTRLIIRECTLVIHAFLHWSHGQGSASMIHHIESTAKFISYIDIAGGQIPLDQAAYDKIEIDQPLLLAPAIRAWPRVYEYISNHNFRITVKVKDGLPPLSIDNATVSARFCFDSDRERQEALSNFINSLKTKSVLSWRRHSDIF